MEKRQSCLKINRVNEGTRNAWGRGRVLMGDVFVKRGRVGAFPLMNLSRGQVQEVGVRRNP